MTALPTAPPRLEPAPPAASSLPLLVAELEAAVASCLEPAAFFVSWQARRGGFTQPLIETKERITAAHPSLPPENPGSKWPKTSLGCLRDGRRLAPDELARLIQICKEESAATFRHQPGVQQQQQAAGKAEGIRLTVDSAAVVLFECRSLERLLSCQSVVFQGGFDASPPRQEEVARVASIVAEQDSPDYWFAASKDGYRESHYRGSHLGATLMHPLLPEPWEHEAGEVAHAGAAALSALARPGLHARGLRELADRQALLAAVARFRARVDAALPGAYAWFSDASLHITLRALIN
ncbi:hypothetical protein ABPG75_002396 [Micractinium tetrahymenae]